ncbi:MAG: transglutaminase domain-containing protein [Candidatus Eisenbacteria bacterium]
MNVGDVVIAIGSMVAGFRALRSSLGGIDSVGRVSDVRQAVSRSRRAGTKPKATPYNVYTIGDRVSHIRKVMLDGRADPEVRILTGKLLSKKCGKKWCIEERDSWGEVKAIFKLVKENVRYTSDPVDIDLFQHPMRILESGAGDCDCMTIILGSMLMSVGYSVKMRVIRGRGARDWNHIYLLVGLPRGAPKQWVPLDASVPDAPPGWQPGRTQIAAYRDFRVL